MQTFHIVFLITIFSHFANLADGIKCYQCEGKVDGKCKKPHYGTCKSASAWCFSLKTAGLWEEKGCVDPSWMTFCEDKNETFFYKVIYCNVCGIKKCNSAGQFHHEGPAIAVLCFLLLELNVY